MSEVVAGGPCYLCGRNPAAGFASSWTASEGERWYCHGDDDETPTCYERHDWTDNPNSRERLGKFIQRLGQTNENTPA